MIGEYRFFQDFFDGQIVKEDSSKFKMFKLLLVSILTCLGLFFVFIDFCNVAEFLLLELGMLWNFYMKLNNKASIAVSVVVSLLYFFFAINFAIYANALIYIAGYLPFQLIAISKDYQEGDFIQIKKHINQYNKMLFFIFFGILFVVLALFVVSIGGRFAILDALTATLLICSALLRNERYCEYYVVRLFALFMSIVLWVTVVVEYGSVGSLAIILMYLAYFIHDLVSYIVQNKTYVNEYMMQVEKMQRIEENLLIKEKTKLYNKRNNE